MKITFELLKSEKACISQVILFTGLFPDGVEPTEEVCVSVAQNFDWNWAARRFLSPKAWEAYNAATQSAREASGTAEREAREAYDAATQSDQEACETATQEAWEAYNAATQSDQEAYNAATREARKAYDAATREAWKAYGAATQLAREVYRMAQARAFAQTWKLDYPLTGVDIADGGIHKILG